MHACGHDAHTAYMYSRRNIDRNERTIQGKVVIIHQPAEEMPPGGAQE